VIPTIEITLSEDEPSALDEMISLFVDINSYGVQVKRFDIVKAMSKDKLLKGAFGLIAQRQTRGKDVHYRAKNNEFTKVLKRLQIVENLRDANAKVDRMWELLVEIILFLRTKKHRTPVDILQNFIKVSSDGHAAITKSETAELRKVFQFLLKAYNDNVLSGTRLAKNQIHFYTMITALMASDLMARLSEADLIAKLSTFGAIIDGKESPIRTLTVIVKKYQDLAAKHTTHPGRRADRQAMFLDAVKAIT